MTLDDRTTTAIFAIIYIRMGIVLAVVVGIPVLIWGHSWWALGFIGVMTLVALACVGLLRLVAGPDN